MPSATKRRSDVTYGNVGKQRTYSNGVLVATTLFPSLSKEIQVTTSEGHPFNRTKRKKKHEKLGLSADSLRNTGGPFSTRKRWNSSPQEISVRTDPTFTRYEYDGPITASIGLIPNLTLDIPFLSDSVMNAFGTSAIAKTSPTSASAGMGQFLGELRQLPTLPGLSLLKARAKKIAYSKAIGSEYLNYMFGWYPFAKDLVDLAKTAAKQDQIIAQFERDSGRSVRRRITLLDTTSTSTTTLSEATYPSPGLPLAMYSSAGKLTRTITTSHRVWFSGAFKYYLQSGRTTRPPNAGKGGNTTFFAGDRENPAGLALRRQQIVSKLYGLRADPYLFYQLYPWSWLADWMTNLGSVVKNLVAFSNDGLVMWYGYTMSHQTETTVYNLKVNFKNGGPQTLTDSVYKSCKQRGMGTPFGFGANPQSFTPRQWSILAALGVSRAPKSLTF